MSSQRNPSLGVIFLTVLIDLLGFGIVLPFLPLQARDAFGVDPLTAAALGALYSAMQFVFMPVWGRLSDRIGRRPVMLTSIFFSAVGMTALGAGLAWADSMVWLFLARGLTGCATANIGTASAYIADITAPEDRVKGMGMIGLAFGLGFLIGPGVGGLLASHAINGRHGPWACFGAAALSAINLVWAFTSLPESLPPERRGKGPQRSLSPLRLDALRTLWSTRGIGNASFANFSMILAFSALDVIYAMYAEDLFTLEQNEISWFFVFMGLIAALVQGLFVRRMSGKVRETSMARGGLFAMMVGFAGFAIAPCFGLPALFVVSALIALGNGFTTPSVSAYISRLADPTRQGETLSANQSMSALARMFGPILGGSLYGLTPSWAFISCAALNGIGLLLTQGMLAVQPQSLTPQVRSARS